MIKKAKFSLIISFILLLSTPFIPSVFGDDLQEDLESNNDINEQIIETSTSSQNDNSTPSINSRAAIILDRNSDTILFRKNENEQRKMASTTKIMTSIIVIENCNLSDTVEISKKSAGTGGSRLGLKTGDKITVNDLLYGLMLCSGNDAAVALAEFSGGSIDGFAELMNKKAKELNLNNTSFETPHGLDAPNHYTTAYELALLSKYALNNETFSKIVGTKTHTISINGYPKTISNTNELLGNLNGVYGIKTGFTNGANRCLVTACKRNNLDIICVVLGADTKKFRTQDSIKLIEYAFKTFEPVNIQELLNNEYNKWKEKNIKTFNILKGENNNINLKIEPLQYPIIPIKKELIDKINITFNCDKIIEAPVIKDSKIGYANIIINDINSNFILTNCDIIVDSTINKKNIFTYFIDFLKLYKNFKICKL